MKKLLLLIATVCCIALTSSCQKTGATCGYDATELKYIDTPEGYTAAQNFLNECQSVNGSFDKTEFTENEYISAMEKVVNKYDHQYISGPFKIFKDNEKNVIKTFNMTFAENLEKSEISKVSGLL